MTDLDAKAREIAGILNSGHILGIPDDQELIATALREARNSALEEAAGVAVQTARDAFLSGSDDGKTVAFALAARIRALKGE